MRVTWVMIGLIIVGVMIGALDLNLYAKWAYVFGDKGIDALQESVDEFKQAPTAPTVERL